MGVVVWVKKGVIFSRILTVVADSIMVQKTWFCLSGEYRDGESTGQYITHSRESLVVERITCIFS